MVSNTADDCLQRQIAQKIFNLKIKAHPVHAGHYIAFHLRPIGLQTLVAINSESCQTSFPSFCAPPSEVAVLFDSNLSRRPFLGQVVDLDLLLCTGFDLEHAVLFLCHIFTQRRMNDRKIEQSDGCCFGLQQLLANSNYSIEYFISNEKQIRHHCPIYTKHLTFLTLKLSQYSKSGSTFSSSEPVRPAATAADSKTPCICARPSDPPKLCRSAAVFWNSLRE